MSTVVVQITRGIAPAPSIASVVMGAAYHGWPYRQIWSMRQDRAKNEAARIARQMDADLLLVEDDVMVPWDAWPTASDAVSVVTVRCRGTRKPNTTRAANGEILYSGTCMVRVPWQILCLLGSEPFRGSLFHRKGDEMRFVGEDPNGRHSDVYFYSLCRYYEVPIVEHGMGTSIWHPLSGKMGPVDLEAV